MVFQGDVIEKKIELEKDGGIRELGCATASEETKLSSVSYVESDNSLIILREQEKQAYSLSKDEQFERMSDDIYEQYSQCGFQPLSSFSGSSSVLAVSGFSFFYDPNKRKNMVVRPDLYYVELESSCSELF